MKTYNFGEKIEGEISLCLGYFDSVHKGHRAIFQLAQNAGGSLAVFTFSDSPQTKQSGVVFTFEERLEIYKSIGVEILILADFAKIKDLNPTQFLQILDDTCEIKSVTCGFDYKFGKMAKGDIKMLESHFKNKLQVCEKVDFENEKASSNQAKVLVKNGEIEKLNSLLQSEYFVSGYCEKGFQNGTKLGFPTANIKPSQKKILLKEGVYIGETKIDGQIYKSMINVGKVPTFGGQEYKIETHCIGISKPLYGKQITVYFKRFLRDVVKFSSIEELKTQLAKDIKEIK
ncbi:MAG: riboflavin biosynthesis protein RibF [Bacillota bacterium]